jgi:hypothetical protein
MSLREADKEGSGEPLSQTSRAGSPTVAPVLTAKAITQLRGALDRAKDQNFALREIAVTPFGPSGQTVLAQDQAASAAHAFSVLVYEHLKNSGVDVEKVRRREFEANTRDNNAGVRVTVLGEWTIEKSGSGPAERSVTLLLGQ